jgi:hypothetical protein
MWIDATVHAEASRATVRSAKASIFDVSGAVFMIPPFV